jgi:hypothetical protein
LVKEVPEVVALDDLESEETMKDWYSWYCYCEVGKTMLFNLVVVIYLTVLCSIEWLYKSECWTGQMWTEDVLSLIKVNLL